MACLVYIRSVLFAVLVTIISFGNVSCAQRSHNQTYLLDVEILTYFNNWDTRFPCTGINACGATYQYCLREFGSVGTGLCLSDGGELRESPLGVVQQESATNITLNVVAEFVVDSSFPDSAFERIQFFFQATSVEDNIVSATPVESFSTDIIVETNGNYNKVISTVSDGISLPAGVLETRIRAKCMDNFFGPGCSVFCAPQDDDLGHFVCDAQGNKNCLPGYCGPEENCVKECNECRTDPCLNGGVCKDLFDDFHCHCLPGFTGDTCEIMLSATEVMNSSTQDSSSPGFPSRLVIGITVGVASGALLLLGLLVVLGSFIGYWKRHSRTLPLQLNDIDPQDFEPVKNFHINPTADLTDTMITDKFQHFEEGINKASYISVNPVDMEQQLYESLSDSEEPNEIVHVMSDSNNYVISTSRETTI